MLNISSDVIRGYNDTIILYLLLDRPSYGYEISKQIKLISEEKYVIKETTLYSAFTRLEKNGYIIMDGSGHLYLTDEGRSVAEKTFERHRVLTKVFTKLGVSAGIAAEDACKIEHVISDETFEAIKRFAAEHSD